MTKELEPREARQGRSRKNVLIILVVSMAIAIAVLLFFEGVIG